jgi:glutathione synthase/RimK-type ligase-like ATP-grasp enzyme
MEPSAAHGDGLPASGSHVPSTPHFQPHSRLPPPIADVALLTESRYMATSAPPGDWYLENILREDALLKDALRESGLSSVRVDWADPGVDWTRFRCAVLRTTWDYFDRIKAFRAWLGRVEGATRLFNPASLVRWNLDKEYLGELAERGVPVVPSRFLEPGDGTPLDRLLEETGWSEAVIKPRVSGAARLTFRVNPGTAPSLDARLRPHRAAEAFLLQPFQAEVLRSGEVTLVLVEGEVTHGVRKLARPGDFRVQDDHGGTVHPHDPTPREVEVARQAMAACPSTPLYGRVDLVEDGKGGLFVMEVELIEPELWLRARPLAATALAGAIARRLRQG